MVVVMFMINANKVKVQELPVIKVSVGTVK